MGLIQRAIEAAGIPTISISLNRTITGKVKPPRAILVGFLLGHPMGNPFDAELQTQILLAGLKYLKEIDNPGTIMDLTGAHRMEGRKCLLYKQA